MEVAKALGVIDSKGACYSIVDGTADTVKKYLKEGDKIVDKDRDAARCACDDVFPGDHRAQPLSACAATNIAPGVYRVTSLSSGDGHVLQRETGSDRLTQIAAHNEGQAAVEIGHYGPENCYFVVVGGGCVTVPENNWTVTGPDGLRAHNGTNRYGGALGRCEDGDNDKWSIGSFSSPLLSGQDKGATRKSRDNVEWIKNAGTSSGGVSLC